MNLGAPHALWFLGLLPVLVLLVARAEAFSERDTRRLVAVRLLPALVGRSHVALRRGRSVLVLLAFVLGVLALAGPRWGHRWEEIRRVGRDVILGIDTSRSMLARDVAPDRLSRAKLVAQDIVDALRGDRVGLVAFAGRAFLQAPLTADHGAVLSALAELDPEIIPRGGTNLAEAIRTAAEAFGKAEGFDRALVLLTDGEELDADGIGAAREAARQRIVIYTVGIGSAEGTPIQLTGGADGAQYVRDGEGKVVRSRLDEARLREIARGAGGFYLPLGTGAETARRIVGEGLGKMGTREIEERRARRPIERYQWPLGGAVFLLALALLLPERRRSARRAAVAGRLIVLLLLAAGPSAIVRAGAAPVSGVELYRDARYAEAYERFRGELKRRPDAPRLHFNAGCAAFRGDRLEDAARHFSSALLAPERDLQERAHYNLGNTLYERGARAEQPADKRREWEDALRHFDAALGLDPKNDDARFNRDLVRRKLDELERQQQEQQQQQEQSEKGQKGQTDQTDQTDQRGKGKAGGDEQRQQQQQQQQPTSPSGERGEVQRGRSSSGRPSDPAPDVPRGQRPSGELRAAGGEGEPVEAESAEPVRDGELNSAQARGLLEALRDEEERVWLFDREKRDRAYKDW